MKSFAIASVVVLLSAASALAGDRAVSKSTLEGMGLGSMQQLSDQDGMAVRGKGAFDLSAFGLGAFSPRTSAFGGSSLSNHFSAGDLWFGGAPSGGNNPSGGFGGLGLSFQLPQIDF